VPSQLFLVDPAPQGYCCLFVPLSLFIMSQRAIFAHSPHLICPLSQSLPTNVHYNRVNANW
jgi:hypothetical protein